MAPRVPFVGGGVTVWGGIRNMAPRVPFVALRHPEACTEEVFDFIAAFTLDSILKLLPTRASTIFLAMMRHHHSPVITLTLRLASFVIDSSCAMKQYGSIRRYRMEIEIPSKLSADSHIPRSRSTLVYLVLRPRPGYQEVQNSSWRHNTNKVPTLNSEESEEETLNFITILA
ncbi:hypothetical protein QE152_g26535 [Popillia japonica]|uniref:Uncharacterized protein n=1 Tax=Popillia japonica TaxID=7064 RepID=A0AAW1JY13_POPJA